MARLVGRRRILFDFDDVLFPLQVPFGEWNNRKYGTNLIPDQINVYDMERALGLTKVEVQNRYWEYHADMEADPRNVRPIPGAVDMVRMLGRQHDLMVGTSREWRLSPFTTGVASYHFGPDAFEQLLHLGDGYVAAQCKSDAGRERYVDLAIDDHPGHITACVEAGIPGILFGSYPWNRDDIDHPLVRRAVDMWALPSAIEDLIGVRIGF